MLPYSLETSASIRIKHCQRPTLPSWRSCCPSLLFFLWSPFILCPLSQNCLYLVCFFWCYNYPSFYLYTVYACISYFISVCFCIACVYSNVTNRVLWLQQTNKVYLLTYPSFVKSSQRIWGNLIKLSRAIKLSCQSLGQSFSQSANSATWQWHLASSTVQMSPLSLSPYFDPKPSNTLSIVMIRIKSYQTFLIFSLRCHK